MGTMLYGKGVFINRCFKSLNQSQPDLVVEVHGQYLKAGADVIETNTFGANRMKLRGFGLGDQVREINLAGATLARSAVEKSGCEAYVAGAIGPLGVRVEPWGKTGVDEAEAMFRDQAQALLDGKVDLFILETFRDLNEIGAAIAAVRSICDLPIVAQMTTEEDGLSLDGAPPEQFAPDLIKRGASVVGVNCSVGPAPMLETVERISDIVDVWLSAQPNAGKPRDIEGRNLYLCSPEYMASYARRFIASGVRLVGGCCGTTPEHIRQIKSAVRLHGAEASARIRRTSAARTAVATAPLVPPVSRAEKSRMANGLSRGTFVVSVELLPPRGFRVDALVEQARQLRIHGVDLVNIPDGPRAGARMSALSAAVLVQQQAGIETILHCACRDRNLLGLQSDLLGAHSMGVRNLLLITGDPPQIGDYPDATAVMDVDSIGLTNMVKRLNDGSDIGDQHIGAPTAFHIGVAANPAALDPDEELRRFEHKVKAGAEFAITQLVFDVEQLAQFLRSIEPFRIPVLAAIAPLESLRHAEFLANELPGVRVPDAIVERMRRAEAAGRATAEGQAIAREIAAEIRPLVQGIQISPAGDSIESALGIMEAVVA